MRSSTLFCKSILYHWRVNLPVVLGAAVATSTLTGALVVGDSMRASLEKIALGRLGRIDHALVAQKFFRQQLADEIGEDPQFQAGFDRIVPVIMMHAGAIHAELRTRAGKVNVIGIDDRFWTLGTKPRQPGDTIPDRSVILNQTLASELRAGPGNDVLLRTAKPSAIPIETLLGRRDENTSTLRLTVHSVIPAEGLGAFGLLARQTAPRNAFVPLSTLQRALDQPGRVNSLLVVAKPEGAESSEQVGPLHALVQGHATLDDYALSLRVDQALGYAALESRGGMIPVAVEEAAGLAAARAGVETSRILAYLANAIDVRPGGSAGEGGPARIIPYSTVVAVEAAGPSPGRIARHVGVGEARLEPGDIVLNRWAATDLAADPGDQVVLTYYVTGRAGEIETKEAAFKLRGVLEMEGVVIDPGFVPTYPGVTDTENLTDWDAPFPVDLTKIRPKDEEYWDRYGTAPKAFISLADGQRLWASDSERFGRLTSIQVVSRPDESVADIAARFEKELLGLLEPPEFGLAFEPVRSQAALVSRGATDFGMLFIGFSFFLIASGAMVVGLLFRLGVQRRAREVGILLAAGFSPRTVTIRLVAEGALLAALGAVIGSAGAVGYAWMMLAGLRTWWSAAVNAPILVVAANPTTIVLGLACSVALAGAATAWATRGLSRRSVPALLAAATGDGVGVQRRSPWTLRLALAAFVAAGVAAVAGLVNGTIAPAMAFFLSGACMLVAGVAWIARWLANERAPLGPSAGARAAVALAVRNASRNRGRSILICTLIASAAFVISALESLRLGQAPTLGHDSGTGGFSLFAESAAPLPYDLSTRKGRAALGVEDPSIDDRFSAIAFRLRPGDATSCLNLYVPREPRILGAPKALVERSGFRFAGAANRGPDASANPWVLLDSQLEDGVVPAIGDEAAVLWQLHLGLGQDLVLTDERGREVRLRFVALLKGSMLQDEIIISEENFERLFPSIEGHAFFLMDAPPGKAAEVELALERELERFGFDAGTAADRLAGYSAVQNTYLSTFQSLGGLGLLLGTLGLAAVVLRNVWERRRELAVLRALGYSPQAIGTLVLLENVTLVCGGLFAGLGAAAIAVLPRILETPADIPWLSVVGLAVLVLACGSLAGIVGLVAAVRVPLVPSIRSE